MSEPVVEVYAVTRLVTVRDVPEGQAVCDEAVDAVVMPPEHARTDADGDVVWITSELGDRDCPACAARACVQQALLRGDTLMVAHDVGATLN